jgi:hypothetical protein
MIFRPKNDFCPKIDFCLFFSSKKGQRQRGREGEIELEEKQKKTFLKRRNEGCVLIYSSFCFIIPIPDC